MKDDLDDLTSTGPVGRRPEAKRRNRAAPRRDLRLWLGRAGAIRLGA